MRGIDLDAIGVTAVVEEVARDFYDHRMARIEQENPGAVLPDWDHVDAMSAHSIREAVLPVVTATLRALKDAS